MAWDRVDIAKSEIFNGDVEWKVPTCRAAHASRPCFSLTQGEDRTEGHWWALPRSLSG